MKDSFSKLHPIISFIYFIIVIGLTMFISNPICIVISFICSMTNAIYLNGRKTIKLSLVYLLPMLILITLINPLFNHRGVTIIGYLPWGNPLTLESIIFGIITALLLASTILWFSCFNSIVTSDKIIFIFGKIIPSLSLILSMSLRFVSQLSLRIKEIRAAQKSIGKDITDGNILIRIKNLIKIISILTTWSLESSINKADSMKSRGYGIKGRTAYSVYKFDKRDFIILISIIIAGITALIINISFISDFRYFPKISGSLFDALTIQLYIIYAALMLLPIIINTGESARWKFLQSKI